MKFNYETITTICSLIGFVITLLCWIFSLIKKSKNSKAKKIAENALSVLNVCSQAIQVAEGFKNYTGEEKKAHAVCMVKEFCIENGIEINNDEISNDIENLITLSKNVNAVKRSYL